jgi:hypothetical protein
LKGHLPPPPPQEQQNSYKKCSFFDRKKIGS